MSQRNIVSSDASESPLTTAAGAVGPETTEAFGLLANETRLAIMLALWEAYDPHAEDNAVGFTELRGRVGIRQGAQFNCHLDQLVGVFVDSTDGGYRLRPVGLNLVQTLIAGTGQWGTFPWTEIDVPCHLCGAPTAVTVRDGWLYHVCTECDGGLSAGQLSDGTLFGEPFPPAAPANRTAEEIFAAGVFRLRQVTVMKLGGLCPRCSGVVESRLHICEDHDTSAGSRCRACGNASQVRIRWTGSVCKYWGGSAPSSALFAHSHGQRLLSRARG